MHWRRGISLDHQLQGQVATAHLPTEL